MPPYLGPSGDSCVGNERRQETTTHA